MKMRVVFAAVLALCMTAPALAITTDARSIIALIRATPALAIDTTVPASLGFDPAKQPYVRIVGAPEGTSGGYIDPDYATIGTLADGTRVLAVPLESGGSGGVFTQILFAQTDGAAPVYAGYVTSAGHLRVDVSARGIIATYPIYGPNDANCCPKQYGHDLYGIAGGKLVSVSLFSQLAGAWSCQTGAGSAVTAAFSVDPSGNAREQQSWSSIDGKAGGTWDQAFSYDAASAQWNAKNTGSNGWVFNGTSTQLDGTTAEFTGTQLEDTVTVPVRERFSIIAPDRFDHSWETKIGGEWRVTSLASCQKS
jgi:hypothetical protein